MSRPFLNSIEGRIFFSLVRKKAINLISDLDQSIFKKKEQKRLEFRIRWVVVVVVVVEDKSILKVLSFRVGQVKVREEKKRIAVYSQYVRSQVSRKRAEKSASCVVASTT